MTTGWLIVAPCQAQTPASADAERVVVDDGLTVGIQGRYRLGHWTQIRVGGAVDLPADASWEIQTIDGDGVEVRYQQSSDSSPDSNSSLVGYAIASTEAAPLDVLVSDQTLASTRFPEFGSPSKEPSLVPIGMPWVVVIGDAIGVDQIGANELLGREATIAISKVLDSDDLPEDSLGYSGVTMLMINASGMDVLNEMSKAQQDAVVRWVQADGGKLFVCLGQRSRDVLAAAPWLTDLIPVAQTPVLDDLDPAALETYTSSQTQLMTFTGLRLSREEGIPLVTGRTKRRITARFVVRYLSGFGEVIAIAADLDSQPFTDWPDRMTLMNRIHGETLRIDRDVQQPGKRNTAFNDLAGQTRATLDQFSTKRSFQFSVLSLVLMGLILLVGPLDYLVINRVFGRPLLGWVTLPLVVIAVSAMLVRHSRPVAVADAVTVPSVNDATGGGVASAGLAGVDVNHLEVTDIDTIQRVGRGFAWDVVYSHDGGRFDVSAKPTAEWIDRQARSVLVRPYGYASETYGGIQIAADSGLPLYKTESTFDDGIRRTQLRGVPLAPRSSKSVATTFEFDFPMEQPVEVLRRRGGDALQTGLVNPLKVDILDGMLVYRNWVYYLPTRFQSGQEIDSLEQLRQRNFRWHLTRQKATESSSDAQAWDAENFVDPMRLAEMLMFHDVVGGQRYTGLKHEALSELDLTELLADDRCVVIGRLADPLADVRFASSVDGRDQEERADDPALGDNRTFGHRASFVRVVLPVVVRSR